MVKIPLSSELQAVLKRKAFKKKFGRYPRPDDPLFFDPDESTPRPLKLETLQPGILQAMRAAGTPPEVVYAYKKTGRLLSESQHHRHSREASEEWDAAINEYRRLEAEAAGRADLPKRKLERAIPPSKLPEIVADPYSADDEASVFECIGALDKVLAVTPMTVRARMELGAALVALACHTAFESAISQGRSAEEGHERAGVLADLALDRAQELYEMVYYQGEEEDEL